MIHSGNLHEISQTPVPSKQGRRLLLLLLLLLGDAKQLLAAEVLEGRLQDLVQDLLVAVGLTEGVGLGLGLGVRGRAQGREVRGERTEL